MGTHGCCKMQGKVCHRKCTWFHGTFESFPHWLHAIMEVEQTPKLYPRIKGHFTTILHPNDCHEDHYPSLPKTFCLEAFGNRN